VISDVVVIAADAAFVSPIYVSLTHYEIEEEEKCVVVKILTVSFYLISWE